jgi:hypothetical protein
MTQTRHHLPRACMELGVCQSRKPACADCEEPVHRTHVKPTCNELGLCQAQFGRTPCEGCNERPLRLAPGVIEGPYHRTGKKSWAIAGLRDWLQGRKQ